MNQDDMLRMFRKNCRLDIERMQGIWSFTAR
jgi:hypothetical protein